MPDRHPRRGADPEARYAQRAEARERTLLAIRERCEARARRARRRPRPRPRARDRFGRFLPADPYLAEHVRESQDLLAREGTPRREIEALRSAAAWNEYLTTAPLWRGERRARTWLQGVAFYPQTITTSSSAQAQEFYARAGYLANQTQTTAATTWGWATTSTEGLAASGNTWGRSAFPVPARAEVELRMVVPDAVFACRRDPDAVLGETFDELVGRLQEEIMEQHGAATADEVWREWTVEATTWRNPELYGDAWTMALRAVNESPSEDATDARWRVWASGVQHTTGRTSVTAARERLPTREDLGRREREREREGVLRRTRARVSGLRRRVAERRARTLLLDCLSAEQREDLERARGFRVIAESGRTYWVAKGYAGNVYLLDDEGNRVSRYCIHGPGGLPDEDHMLSQKLLLESDEESFRRIANESPAYGRAA